MGSGVDIRMAIGSNTIGLLLVFVMIVGNLWRLRLKTFESKLLIAMLASCFSCCLSDIVAFAVDGGSSRFSWLFVMWSNTWLYASNLLCAVTWFEFLKEHLKIELTRAQKRSFMITAITASSLLVVNVFYPFVFSIDEHNVYSREVGYWIFLGLNYCILANSLILYVKYYRKDRFIRFFPIWLYVIPIVASTVIQSIFYGVSLMAPSFAVAIAGAFTSLQNEQVFRDHLTGLFNRSFLNYVLNLYSAKGGKATGIIVKLFAFDNIVQQFGQGEGDNALKSTALIINRSVGQWGSILRYSDDEFIIMVDSQFDMHISNCFEKLKMNFDIYNREGRKPYQLIPSIGFKKFNAEEEDIYDFINGLKKSLEI